MKEEEAINAYNNYQKRVEREKWWIKVDSDDGSVDLVGLVDDSDCVLGVV